MRFLERENYNKKTWPQATRTANLRMSVRNMKQNKIQSKRKEKKKVLDEKQKSDT
jgi:hypothetical protein